MKQNLCTRTIDKSNVGNSAVLLLADGTEQSVTITDVCPNVARFEWRTGPRKNDYRYAWIRRTDWPAQVLGIFPVGVSFMVVPAV